MNREEHIALAKLLHERFWRCPTSGRVLAASPNDNKVLCACGKSNPKVPQEDAEHTGCHLIWSGTRRQPVWWLKEASAEEYVDGH